MAQPVNPSTHISIEIACALPQHQFLRKLEVAAGTTIEQAIALSGIEEFLLDRNCTAQLVGIFGKRASLQTILQANDRVEIYRPLVADPMTARRKRAAR